MRRALLAAVVAALCLPAGAAAAVPPDFFGVMANGPLDAPGFALDAESTAMRSAGVQSERMEVAWDLTEPAKGQYDFALTDRKVLAAARAGLDVLALIVRSPAWAARHPGQPFSSPRDPADYAAFARVLVARYGPGGTLWAEHPEVGARPVRAWQVWNEPNLAVYWSEQPFMRGYARLLGATYAAIKQADPGATVVMAGLANFSWRDLARLFAKGATKLRFDAAAVHPFSGRPSNAVKIVGLNREVLNRNGARRKPIWLTELTWSSAKGKKAKLTKNWETTEAGQALRLRQAYALFVRARRVLRLERIYWYTWVTVDRGSPNSFDYSGLRTQLPDGSVVDKPAAGAFRAVVRRYG
jgi:polysaccharide biosynthesis protein PslG